MPYSSESARWKAYQFLDPFAANSFLVCNRLNKRFCRPDCDAYPVSECQTEIEFVNTCQEAMDLGYVPCESCDPTLTPHIDVNLLIQTVRDVNALIGFMLPSLDDKDDKELVRRQSTAAGAVSSGGPSSSASASASVSKNNSEHYRLVDLACRHLALAAAVSIMNPLLPSNPNSPSSDDGSSDSAGKKKRKRRGGVLGFKELAAKLKLSAWHFHRVFKSVTGMTPKTYSDMCWEYLHDEKAGSDLTSSASSTNLLLKDTELSVSSLHLPVTSRKRSHDQIKEETPESALSPKKHAPNHFQTPHMPPAMVNPAFTLDDSTAAGFGASRAFSDTDLNMAAQMPSKTQPDVLAAGPTGGLEKPYSLFSHLKSIFGDEDSSLAMSHMPQVPEQSPIGSLSYNYEVGPADTVAPQDYQEMPFADMADFVNGPSSGGYSADVFSGAGTDLTGGLDEDFLKMEPDASDINDALNLGLSSELLTTNVGL